MNKLILKQEENPTLSNEDANRLHASLIKQQVFKSCINCDKFGSDAEICMPFNARPPATTLVFGCVDWVPSIPF